MTALYGLIFDVDGVIADSETVNVRASTKVFADMFGNTIAADPDHTKQPDLTIEREIAPCA